MISTPQGAPDWARTLVNQVNSAFQRLTSPKSPTKLATFVAGAGPTDPKRTLPAAASCADSVIWVSDISRLACSNGAHWIRQDTGASL